MFLVDTNVWLEVLLGQDRAAEAKQFLQKTPTSALWITEFTIYSVGIILMRTRHYSLWKDFLSDTVLGSEVIRVRLEMEDLQRVLDISQKYGLDFDDAYQYITAEKHNLTLISLDSDFDRTPRGRRTPAQILSGAANPED